MWFRNLTLFRFQEPFTLSEHELASRLEALRFRPCLSQEMASYGWVSPQGRKGQELVYAVDGCMLLCLQTEAKVLPPAVLKEIVAERVAEIEEREGRNLRRKEKDQLKDEVLMDLLPRAFSRSRQSYAYIDAKRGWLVVDAVGRKAVEELTGVLRKTLGSLPVVPPRVQEAPAAVMTGWLLQGELPIGIELADECELRAGGEEGGVVRCKGEDLVGEEIRTHLAAGKQVTRLALSWSERIGCVLGEDLSVRRLRFLDQVQEQLPTDAGADEAQRFDAELALMTGELREFLPSLLEWFGGEVR
ncbi:MAG TPA: recombination-associated protein RdgC [Candidatus Competibacteraceae bacterium]|nr:recombination-associated protein RdgC [Candidatus Competibacteraceae bacterium]